MTNPGTESDLGALTELLPGAVDAATAELSRRREEHDTELDRRLDEPTERVRRWVRESNQLAFTMDERRRGLKEKQVGDIRRDTESLIESLRTKGQPLVRVVAVLVGRDV